MTDDLQLLRRYTEERAEPAFGELVARHIDLVYSAALRVVGGDRQLAQDVTQTVFADLARKARSLPREVVLAGWLYRHACFTAAKSVRAERRSKTREKTAMEMNALHDSSEPNWEQIAPVLDEAMGHLSASDRDAIRTPVYFEFDRSEITDEGIRLLDQKVDALQRNASVQIRIEGNADDSGSDEYNMALSQRRAATVGRYFTERGINATRIRIVSYGEERPACTTSRDEDCRGKNRRDEFVILSGL